jgi:hypothetical protein
MSGKRLTILAAALMLLLAAIPAFSQGRRGGNTTPVSIAAPAMITVEGSVTAVDFQYGSGYPNFELIASATKYTVFVGPLRFLDDNDFEIAVGDQLKAVIFPDPQSNNVYVAAVLTNVATGQSLTLRDAAGLPLWIQGARNGHAGFAHGSNAGQGPSVRQGQGPDALRAGQPSIDISTLKTFVGTVTKVDIAAGETHPTIEVALVGGGTAVFCLGPVRHLEQIQLAVSEGSSVSILAADCAQDSGEFVVFEITVDGKTFKLRAADGTPLWYFGHGR